MGHAVDYDREFRLKAVVAEGTDEVAKTFLEFEPSYVFRAGQLKDTVEVYVLNPGARVNYTIGIVLDTILHWNWEQRKRMNIKCY